MSLSVPCPRCKARPGTRCFNPGAPRDPASVVPSHPEREREAAGRQIEQKKRPKGSES